MSDFFVLSNGQQQGPYSDDQLQQMATKGEISPSTHVWAEGFEEWVPASDLDGIDWTRKNKLLLSHSQTKLNQQHQQAAAFTSPQVQPQFSQNYSPPYQGGHSSQNVFFDPNPPVSVGDWMVTLLLASIPLVNLVMFFVWAFSDGTNRSKANWSKATLIYGLISILIWLPILFFSSLGSSAFVRAREQAQINTCRNNQFMIESAKDQWAIETGQLRFAEVSESNITPYLFDSELPLCPSGGTYSINYIGRSVRCSHHGELTGTQ